MDETVAIRATPGVDVTMARQELPMAAMVGSLDGAQRNPGAPGTAQ